MACNKCYNKSCNGKCNSITRQIRLQNNSIGRDGESAYETYVRLGGTLSEKDWSDLNINNNYSTDNWII